MIQMNLFTNQIQSHRHRKQSYGCQRGGVGRNKLSFGLIYTHYYI